MEPFDPQGFDMLAASLRADTADLPSFLEAWPPSSPTRCQAWSTVKRSGGLFAKSHPVAQIDVSLDDHRYTAAMRGPMIDTSIAHEVRGVRLSGDAVPLDAWITQMGASLDAYAQRSAMGSAALRRLLS